MLKKFTYEELSPYAEKLKQMAIDKLVGSFDLKDMPFYSLSTSSGIGDATVHTLLCPKCHGQFTTAVKHINGYTYNSPICTNCGFSRRSRVGYNYNHIVMYTDKTHVNSDTDVYAIREGNVIIAGTCSASANFVDDGTTFDLVPEDSSIYSIIAFGPEKATCFKFEGENEPKKMKYDKHAEQFFNEYRVRWGSPVKPVNPEIKSWMDDMGYKSYSDVIDYYKSKRKIPVVTKPTIDPTVFREYDFSDLFESLKDRMVVYISGEFDALKRIKKTFYWCEHCKREFIVEEESSGSIYGYGGFGRYDSATCPYCRREDRQINIRPSVDYSEDLGTVALIQEYNDSVIKDGVLGRFYRITVKTMLDGDNIPFYEFFSEEDDTLVMFDRNKQKLACFKNIKGVYENETIRDFNSMSYKSIIVDAAKGSWLSYIGIPEYNDAVNTSRGYYGTAAYNITRYLVNVAKYPVLEKIVKIGYGGMAAHAIASCQTDTEYTSFVDMVNNKKTIDEAFGFPVKLANKLKDYVRTVSDIFYFRHLYQLDKTANPEDYIYAKQNSFTSVKQVFDILKNINMKSICAYMEGVRVHQCFPPNEAFGFWRDYLATCAELGMDVNDKQVKFPNSLKREHDKAIAKRKFVYDEEKNKAFISQTSRCQELYGHETKEFIIRAPRDTKELFEEGRILSHSVGSYTDIITKGETCIMFVRKASEPEKPWYTLEINEPTMSIPEIKGYCNRLVDEEIEVPLCKFLVKWADWHKLDIDKALRTSKKIRALNAEEKRKRAASSAA